MNMTVVDLFAPSGLRLREGSTIEVETPPRMWGDQDGWMVACYHAASDQDVHGEYWEIHPYGQEVVSVLSGRARLVLRAEEGRAQEEAVTLTAGTAYVVPRNRWHRLEVDGPTDLQAITPRHGTRLDPRS
jgi:mannose-6-phosphate isomerase-like protein (cupin superfamily)